MGAIAAGVLAQHGAGLCDFGGEHVAWNLLG
jgi:hypothetical protein